MAVVFVQTAVAGGGAPVFGANPTNGNKVSVIVLSTSDLTAATVKDTNNVSLTQQVMGTDGLTMWVAIYDYTVVGSPLKTYTGSVAATTRAYEISGASGTAHYAQNGAAVAIATLATTITQTISGDGQLGGYRENSAAAPGNLAFSNGTIIQDDIFNQLITGHCLATSTASSTLTATMGTTGVGVAMAQANYTPGAAGGSSFGVNPGMGVFPGGMPGMP